MKTLIESINTLNKNISEAATEKETVLEGLQEFVDVINEDTETTIESITDAAEKIAEILPDKIGITPTGTIEITENGTDIDIAQYATADVAVPQGVRVNESYDISERTLNGATYTIAGGVTAHIPDGVVTIGKKAFDGNATITKVIMPDSITTIENGEYQYPGSPSNVMAFGGCANLKEVVFSNNLTSIGDYTFHDCSSLTSITIPDSVTSIGDGAFSYCSSLTSITIPNSVTSIGNYAFENCTSLTDIYYTGTQAEWGAIRGISNAGIPVGATIHYEYVPK